MEKVYDQDIILKADDLTIGYTYKKEGDLIILSDLNLEVHAGQVLCILGPNGSGKSTLLRTVAGIQPALDGRVRVLGEDVNTHNPRKLARMLSVVLTDRIEVRNLTVFQLVSMGRYPYNDWLGRLGPEDKAIVEKSIAQVNLTEYMHRDVDELSDGEQQRVMIAKALTQDTPLIILDEPTAHLDLPNRVEIMRLLRDLANNTGKAILLSSHDLDLALQSSDWLWIIPKGGPVVQGVPEDLVLNGTFEASFETRKVHFNPASGSFLIEYHTEKTLFFEGNGITAFWTMRALARAGFRMLEDVKAPRRLILSDDTPRWTFFDKGEVEEFRKLNDLIVFLKSMPD
jgi:iron complex transport system ATP-binding protein